MIDFLFEVGMLKRIPRTGWLTIGIKNCESVAEHSFRCAIIGFILAKMENANIERVISLCLFHDLPEARIGDIHPMARKYLSKDKTKLLNEMTSKLELKQEIKPLILEYESAKSKEAIIAKDADKLEMLIQAKEYADHGIKNTEKFITSAKSGLKTKSARKLASEINKSNAYSWISSE